MHIDLTPEEAVVIHRSLLRELDRDPSEISKAQLAKVIRSFEVKIGWRE